ncbi:MAG: hypothetical protein L6Q38_05655 [Nitrospira sp.]|nr:hypothetical protein [Nitrospira sp.]
MTNDEHDMKLDAQGLVPAVVQDWLDGTVLIAPGENCGKREKPPGIFCG